MLIPAGSTLFLQPPPEKDLEWSEEGIEGAWRFLNRVYRLVDRHAQSLRAVPNGGRHITPANEKEKSILRKTHQTLRRVTQDFEGRWHFNSAIALIMELSNAIQASEPLTEGIRPEVRKEVLELLILMLAPMTPHLAEELWENLGHSEGLLDKLVGPTSMRTSLATKRLKFLCRSTGVFVAASKSLRAHRTLASSPKLSRSPASPSTSTASAS